MATNFMDSEISAEEKRTSSGLKAAEQNATIFKETVSEDREIVDFDGADDKTNPLNWSPAYRWCLSAFLSFMTLIVTVTVIISAPAAPLILASFHDDRYIDTTFIISIWEIGEIVGTLMIGPLSEVYGRLPVYHTANILFVAFSAAAALSTNVQMLLAFRFLNGMCVASVCLNSVIASDIFAVEDRGKALAIMGLTPRLGPMVGPIVGGYIAKYKGWRWTLWVPTILTGAFELVFLILYRETYKVTILAKKAERLRVQMQNPSLRSRYANTEPKSRFIRNTIFRPFKLLFYTPILLLLSIYFAFVYGYMYLVATTLAEVFEQNYGFSSGQAGLAFIGVGVGTIVGILLCGFTLDRIVKKKSLVRAVKPEDRIGPMALGALTIPIGLFAYGWSAETHVVFIVPIIFTAIEGFGLSVTMVPLQSYIVDAYGIHAASAIAASTIVQLLFGALLPLAGPPLYKNLGLGWGNSVLGFISMVLVPAPWIIMRWGERLRQYSGLDVGEPSES